MQPDGARECGRVRHGEHEYLLDSDLESVCLQHEHVNLPQSSQTPPMRPMLQHPYKQLHFRHRFKSYVLNE